jgi:twitching motility protein PilT
MHGYPKLSAETTQELIYSVMNEDQVAEFESERECDMSFGIDGLSRFRLNVYRDRGSVVGAFRSIPFEILTFEQLGLPRVVADFAYRPLGLVLICGPTGSGKSTTLASVIDKINRERNVHIITIEDPIEYLHSHQRAVVNQREVHADTKSFAASLKRVLRQDPDVILIGEMRDPETIQAALTVAETGHLAFATLHTNDALQTINRIVDVFPSEQQAQVRTQLSFVLEGVLVQQLIPRADGMGRVLAMEIMLPNPAIRSLIRAEKLQQIPSMIEIGKGEGMMTMNQSLYRLMRRGLITTEMGFKRTSDPEGLQNLLDKGL